MVISKHLSNMHGLILSRYIVPISHLIELYYPPWESLAILSTNLPNNYLTVHDIFYSNYGCCIAISFSSFTPLSDLPKICINEFFMVQNFEL